MTIYWLLFAFPAIMALAYPASNLRGGGRLGNSLAVWLFVLFYTLIGALRFETGGDWSTYQEMYDIIASETFVFSLTFTDPVYGVLNWVAAYTGGGIELVNGVCCLVLVLGVVRASERMQEPWLGVLISVPYLLIVVGIGYVRQGAAIGMILIALASLYRQKPGRTLIALVVAAGFHSTAILAFPIFGFAMARRNRVLTLIGVGLAALLYQLVVVPRLNTFDIGYLDRGYESTGATVRVLMGVFPALLVLARYRWLFAEPRARTVWLMIAVANIFTLIALQLSPSSTAVDRVALYFSVIQLLAFGEFRALVNASPRWVMPIRVLLVGIAALVQVVWLVFADHSRFWVPYQSILQTF